MSENYENLKSYRNCWYSLSANRLLMTKGVLRQDISCDVCIIGGGFTGLSAALELSKNGFKVVVLEESELATESSGRNGGQLRRGFDAPLTEMISQYGIDDARHMCNMTLEGTALILKRLTKHEISCDMKFGLLTAAIKSRHQRALKKELAAWEKIGHTDLEYIPKSRVKTMVNTKQYIGGLFDPKGAHLHPLNYALGIAQAAQKLGCRIHDYSPAVRVISEPSPKVITTDGSVSAKFIIIAGSVNLKGTSDNFKKKTITIMQHMIATEPLPDNQIKKIMPADIAITDARHIMNYYRVSGDNRLLFGGTCNYSNKESGHEDQSLRRRMLSVFPGLRTTRMEFFWNRSMDYTNNRLPHVGRLAPNIFFAHGFTGQGVITTNIVGKLLAEIIQGTAERFDIFANIKHLSFIGNERTQRPAFVLMSLWNRIRDIL